jgi:hypothetical protein
MPTIYELFTKTNPLGKLPLIVSAAVPVVLELIMALLVNRRASD